MTAATLTRTARAASRPRCPDWCNGNPETHDPERDANSIIHCRDWPDAQNDRAVVTLDQVDVLDRECFGWGWRRCEPRIDVLQSHKVADFCGLNLRPAQARALASLVADRGDEDLARRLLAAVTTVEASA
jgi:hypothetical protein